jgi:hypothetical protein
MKRLILDDHLEATDMGSDQQKIASWVMGSEKWLEYVKLTNKKGVDTDSDQQPSESWSDSQAFHPDDMITEACEALEWNEVPQSGGLIMNFYLGEK